MTTSDLRKFFCAKACDVGLPKLPSIILSEDGGL
jgi:hypothetical protein